MSGVCGDDLVVFNCDQGSYTCLFQYALLHNESCESEARRTVPSGLQEVAILWGAVLVFIPYLWISIIYLWIS